MGARHTEPDGGEFLTLLGISKQHSRQSRLRGKSALLALCSSSRLLLERAVQIRNSVSPGSAPCPPSSPASRLRRQGSCILGARAQLCLTRYMPRAPPA